MPNEFNLTFSKEHRSLKAFDSVRLPEIVVISGPNGSGKTHLLEAISGGQITATDINGVVLQAKKFDSTPTLTATHIAHGELQESHFLAQDAREFIEDIEKCLALSLSTNVLMASQWRGVTRESILKAMIYQYEVNGQLQFHGGEAERFKQALHSAPDQNGKVRNRWDALKKFVPLRAIRHLPMFTEVELKGAVYDFVQYQTFMQIDVSKIFYRYFEELQNNAYRCASGGDCLNSEQFNEKFGASPWNEVNELLEKYGFRHQLVPPNKDLDPRATNGYVAKIINEQGDYITVADLSSGEKVIIALLLSAYAAQQKQNMIFQVDVPDIILFDELDAHLHPSMTRMMFEVIQGSIIEKLSCRVIISTHSPSTVALAPSSSIFRLTPGLTHILDPVDSETACRDLSDGFIQIMDGSQIVIVEGKDDPLFYRLIERALRSNKELIGLPTLHFIPASQSANPSAGGGASAAVDWASKLKDANLPNIHALLDNDGHRTSNGSIKVLSGRYAIENFVLDPLSLSVALVTDGRMTQIDASLGNKFAQVSSIYNATQDELQELVNAICSFIEHHNPQLRTLNTIQIKYLMGKQLSLPEWVCKARGKDLVPMVREAFKRIDNAYIITRKDFGDYNLELGYLLKLWVQHPALFPVEIKETIMLLRP